MTQLDKHLDEVSEYEAMADEIERLRKALEEISATCDRKQSHLNDDEMVYFVREIADKALEKKELPY